MNATAPPQAWESFERDGFAVVRAAVDPARCAQARVEVDAFKARNRSAIAANVDDTGRLYRVVNLQNVVTGLQAMFYENRALELCDWYFGSEAVVYTTLYFERGSEQDLHRDSPLFTTRPEGRYMGVWVALEDVDGDNGPLIVVPGSHRLPPIDVEKIATDLYGSPAHAPAQDPRGWDVYQAAVHAQCAERGMNSVEVHVGPGDTIVWHPLLLHGGAVQRDPKRTRRSIVYHVTPEGIAVHGQDAFFDPTRPFPERVDRAYRERNGRKIPDFAAVDFAHKYSVSNKLLHRPDEGLAEKVVTSARIFRSDRRRRRAGTPH